MRVAFWAVLGVVGFVSAVWCSFAAVMTAALATGPTTPQQLAGLRDTSNRLLLWSAAWACLSAFSSVRLVLRMRRRKRSAPIAKAD